MFRLSNHVETIDGEEGRAGALHPRQRLHSGRGRLDGGADGHRSQSPTPSPASTPSRARWRPPDLEDEAYFERRYRRRARAMPTRVASRARTPGRCSPTSWPTRTCSTPTRGGRRRGGRRTTTSSAASSRWGRAPGAGRTRPCRRPARAELEDLVARVLPHPRKVEFIERLQSEQEFARTSQLLDPVQRERARTIAAVIPPMAEALEIADDPDVFALLEAMQDAALRERTFALLKDPGLVDRVERGEAPAGVGSGSPSPSTRRRSRPSGARIGSRTARASTCRKRPALAPQRSRPARGRRVSARERRDSPTLAPRRRRTSTKPWGSPRMASRTAKTGRPAAAIIGSTA